MNEQQAITELFDAIDRSDEAAAKRAAGLLLAGALTNLRRIADALEKLANT